LIYLEAGHYILRDLGMKRVLSFCSEANRIISVLANPLDILSRGFGVVLQIYEGLAMGLQIIGCLVEFVG